MNNDESNEDEEGEEEVEDEAARPNLAYAGKSVDRPIAHRTRSHGSERRGTTPILFPTQHASSSLVDYSSVLDIFYSRIWVMVQRSISGPTANRPQILISDISGTVWRC